MDKVAVKREIPELSEQMSSTSNCRVIELYLAWPCLQKPLACKRLMLYDVPSMVQEAQRLGIEAGRRLFKAAESPRLDDVERMRPDGGAGRSGVRHYPREVSRCNTIHGMWSY